MCYNGSVTLRFVREEDTWYWGDDRDFPLEQSIVTELLATVQGYAALSPLPHTDDLSQFGLSDTKRYISLTDTEGNTRHLLAGDADRRGTVHPSRRARRMPCISPPPGWTGR